MRTVASVWVIGLLLSVGLGHVIVKCFLDWLSTKLGLPKNRTVAGDPPTKVTPVTTGVLERLFFTIAVAADIPAYLPAMITWLGLKLVANWQLREDIKNQREKVNYKFSQLLAGFLSMLISLGVGLAMHRLLTSSRDVADLIRALMGWN